jgi:hypothetical protein
MDDKGLIFTADATLAMVVLIVFTASILTYQLLPVYIGEDHQHLEALADSALNVMEQDGTLRAAAVYYANGNNTKAEQILTDSLNSLIPGDVGYKFTLSTYPSVINDRGTNFNTAGDVATRVKVISGPQEGWMGRAYYKLEEVEFMDQNQKVTSTVWNFHNWLTNFDPWDNSGHLQNYPYWGRGTTPQNIAFSIPAGATSSGATFLLGSNNHRDSSGVRGPAYGANVVVNGVSHNIANSSFTFLNLRPGSYETMYNYQGFLNANELSAGTNNFYVNFRSPVDSYSDMPWFSMIANYTATYKVPQGITTSSVNLPDGAGLALQTAQNLNGTGQLYYGMSYNLNTQQRTFFSQSRVITWNNMLNRNHGFDTGVPFVITGIPQGSGTGCAVSVVQDINIPQGARIFDGYVVVNAYGGVDNALVEVWDGTQWRTAFNSFNLGGVQYSARSDGYGNIPGIIYIKDYLRNGNNKVRITTWDQVPSNDYDLVGLVNCYAVTTYSKLPIQWENFPYNSYQSNNNQRTQTRSFTVGSEAQKVLLFVGTGTDSRRIKVDYGNSSVLYDSSTIPYSLDLGDLDAAGPHVFTTGSPGNYSLRPGTYNLRVTVTGPTSSWESGDYDSNAEIYSGTRISVLYPKFLQNIWTSSFAPTAAQAEANARQDLINLLAEAGIPYDPNLIKEEAMYTGDTPNALPVRLDLWRQ